MARWKDYNSTRARQQLLDAEEAAWAAAHALAKLSDKLEKIDREQTHPDDEEFLDRVANLCTNATTIALALRKIRSDTLVHQGKPPLPPQRGPG